jgi:hypothetical protein
MVIIRKQHPGFREAKLARLVAREKPLKEKCCAIFQAAQIVLATFCEREAACRW